MISPVLAHDALIDDIQSAPKSDDTFHIWWLGQSGFLIQFEGRHLLFDPYLSDSLTRKYATTDKPHVRMTELAVAPSRLDFIDVVTSSHNHTDHLDAETLIPLMEANPELTVLVPAANQLFAADRLKVAPDRLLAIDASESVNISEFTLHAVPAAHETVEKDDEGRCRFIGLVAEFGGWTVYHSGDTMLFDGMESILDRWEIDVAFLPINGRAPERRVAGNLNGREAAKLAKDVGMKMVIPCHYDMFEFNTESPEEFLEICRHLEQPNRILQCGERYSLKR